MSKSTRQFLALAFVFAAILASTTLAVAGGEGEFTMRDFARLAVTDEPAAKLYLSGYRDGLFESMRDSWDWERGDPTARMIACIGATPAETLVEVVLSFYVEMSDEEREQSSAEAIQHIFIIGCTQFEEI